MHILSINFNSFTVQIYNALVARKKGDFGIFGGHGPFEPSPPKSAYLARLI